MRDVLVVGAGPAGLATAEHACAAGASVTLLDASDVLGGQFWRHPPTPRDPEPSRRARGPERMQHQWARFEHVRERLKHHPHCRIITTAQVWAIEHTADAGGLPAPAGQAASRSLCGTGRGASPLGASVSRPGSCGLTVHVLVGLADGTERAPLTLAPDALVLATGAHDRVLPFPGWDLPGVFSAGAAQAMAKGEGVAVGSRVIVAGAGPFLLPVAACLTQVGATVLGVYEASTAPALARGWLKRPWRLAGSADKLGELAGYTAGLLRHRIPYHPGTAVVAAHGTDAVEAVTVARLDANWRPLAGTEHRVEADAVCVGHGFTPRLELAIASGCTLTGTRFVAVDDHQRTTVPGVYAAGELTGIGGMPLAEAEGAIAGRAAAGAEVPRALRRERARRARFAARLEVAHGIRPGWTDWLTDETIVCRCEEVDCAALRRAARGSRGLRSSKLTTRAGLGICQGRMCGPVVEDLLARGGPLIGPTVTDRRPIAAPIRLAELAGPAEPAVDPAAPSIHRGKDPS